MCRSLVVCSHVSSAVDATRHTKASWVTKTVQWVEIYALGGRQNLRHVFDVFRQTEARDQSQSPAALDLVTEAVAQARATNRHAAPAEMRRSPFYAGPVCMQRRTILGATFFNL